MLRNHHVEAAACKIKCWKIQFSPHILPEEDDDDDEVGGDAHVAADEAADLSHVDGVLPVVDDRLDDLGTVVDEGDRCQHYPGNEQARLALWSFLDCCREIFWFF